MKYYQLRFPRKILLFLSIAASLLLLLLGIFRPYVDIFKSIGRSYFLHQTYRTNKEAQDMHNTSNRYIDLSAGLIDSSNLFRTHVHGLVGSEWPQLSQQHVCLATHTSLEYIYNLPDLAKRWNGALSVAIFVPDVDFQLSLVFIEYLYYCYPEVKQRMSFHFTYPLEKPPTIEPLDIPIDAIVACEHSPRNVLQDLLRWRSQEMKAWKVTYPYPQNLLRNIARFSCPTKYIMSSDVDMLPGSPHLASQLRTFLLSQSRCVKCSYVIPVYEVDTSVSQIPANKTQLLSLISRRLARPFHLEVFAPSQMKSNLTLWESKRESPMLGVSHVVGNYSFWYEPVFIATGDTPAFDERFVGYGNTRNTQIYEMLLKGWDFLVLDNAFLIHWGFQTVSAYPEWRIQQLNENAIRLKDFLRDMAVRYDSDPLGLLKKYKKEHTLIEIKNKRHDAW